VSDFPSPCPWIIIVKDLAFLDLLAVARIGVILDAISSAFDRWILDPEVSIFDKRFSSYSLKAEMTRDADDMFLICSKYISWRRILFHEREEDRDGMLADCAVEECDTD
jgi:hypothetical protein